MIDLRTTQLFDYLYPKLTWVWSRDRNGGGSDEQQEQLGRGGHGGGDQLTGDMLALQQCMHVMLTADSSLQPAVR